MKANEAPKKLYLLSNGLISYCRNAGEDVEYTNTDAFIEKACEFLYDYNKNMVKKHGSRAVLGCSEFTINVGEFRKYMRGE